MLIRFNFWQLFQKIVSAVGAIHLRSLLILGLPPAFLSLPVPRSFYGADEWEHQGLQHGILQALLSHQVLMNGQWLASFHGGAKIHDRHLPSIPGLRYYPVVWGH